MKRHYNAYYEDEDPEWRRLGALGKADNIMALCHGLTCGSILEIGAGEGAVISRLAEVGFGERLYALEISASGVERIRERGIKCLVECQSFDGYSVPYESGKFDLAIMSHVIEHVEYPRKLIYEAARVAHHVFIEVPLEDTARSARNFVPDKVGHINFYSPTTIRKLLQSCGLTVVKQVVRSSSKAVHCYHDGKRGLVNYHIKNIASRLAPSIAPIFFTYNSALICKVAK